MSVGRWPMRVWVFAGLAVLGLYDLAYIAVWAHGSQSGSYGDFFGLWSFGRFARHSGGLIYDPYALHDYQLGLDPALAGFVPYAYPPTLLLILIPLGLLTLPIAYLCWVVAGLGVYLWATLGRDWGRGGVYGLALLVAPSTLLSVISGQNGMLSAALLAGGLQALRRRPVLAGVLLGLLTYKPQFVLLLPVVLLASRNVTAITASVVTVISAVAASSVVAGWSVWPDWIAGIQAFQSMLAVSHADIDHLMPTVAAGMRIIGAPGWSATAVQLAVSLLMVVMCWRAAAQDFGSRAIAMTMIGSLIMSPYALIYDSPILAAAIVIAWRPRLAAGQRIHIREVCLAIVTFACLMKMTSAPLPLIAPALILALFLTVAWSKEQAPQPRGRAAQT